MKKIMSMILLFLILLLTACNNNDVSGAINSVEKYITALADKNKSQAIALSCKEWEESATLEVDALMSVEASVVDLQCDITGEEGEDTFVVCSGSLDLTYDDEIRAIDLSRRTYTVRQEDGQWRICSYK